MCTSPRRICWPSPKARSPRQACAGTSTSALQYLESWLRGSGCVPIYNLMEDAATAEICRAQVWQWVHHGAHTERRPSRLHKRWFVEVIAEQRTKMKGGRVAAAAEIFERMVTSADFAEFLTLVAYDYID